MRHKSFYRKLLDSIGTSVPPEECNDLELQSLLEVGEKIKQSSFNSLPPSSNFQAKLKARILEKRRSLSLSMSERFIEWAKHTFHSAPFKTALAAVLIVAVITTTIRFWPGSNRTSKLLIDTAYAQDNFEIEPTKSDSLGVENTTEFVIKSKQSIASEELSKHLTIIPAITFNLKKITDHEFHLIPSEQLESKTIYQVHIDSAYVNSQGITTDRDYSWAFQVKDIFKIFNTLPADKSAHVPVNTGIEINLSHENFIDYEKHVSISPKVEGRFEKHGRTLVFVPKQLQFGTIYTVTVDKNLGLEGSVEKLNKDYTFKFETASQSDSYQQQGVRFTTDFTEFGTNNIPLLPVYWFNTQSENASVVPRMQMTVYAYSDSVNFVQALEEVNKIPTWATYNKSRYRTSVVKLTKVTSFDATPQEYKFNQYIIFPEKLSAGYYLVEGKQGNNTEQVFVQVTDLASYINVTKSKTLVWVNDLQTGKPAVHTSIEDLRGNTKSQTNEQGIAVFDSQELISKTEQKTIHYLKITQNNKSAILRLNGISIFRDYSSVDDYWSYFYTDRVLYQSNDTINFWGFVKPRSQGETPQKVTVKLASAWYDFYQESIFLDETTVDVNDQNSFLGKLKLNNITPGNYTLTVSLGDKVILNRYIQVETYTKPAYKIEVTPDKKAFYAGEKIGFTIQASFFEGTPVPRLNLNYAFEDQKGQIVTDDQGKARVEFKTDYRDCDLANYNYKYCGFPRIISLEVTPVQAEEGDIQGSAWVSKFGPSIDVESSLKQLNNTQAQLTVKARQVLLDKANQAQDEYADFLGSGVAQTPLTISVKEISYVPHEDGEYYDFLDKKVYKRYSYERVEKPLLNFDAQTGTEGVFTQMLSIDPEKSYEMEVRATDRESRHLTSQSFLYTTKGYEGSTDYETYYLKFKNKANGEDNFALKQQVEVELLKNGQSLLSGTSLFYTLRQGLLAYEVRNNGTYNFLFSDTHVPNVTIGAVWFDGKSYRTANSYLNARFDTKGKETVLQVTTDKPTYKPGEKVALKVHVEDSQKRPLQTTVNFNLVDEAFYQLSYEVADPLNDLYRSLDSGSVYTYTTHPYVAPSPGGAEGGGCFVDGTKVTMADGTIKNIEDIKKGDRILTFKDEYSLQLVPATVEKTFHHQVGEYLIINNRLFVTPEHRIFINHTWQQIGEAKVGDVLMDSTGALIKIETIEKRYGLVHVHNLQIENYHTYLANGIYVHNDKGGERQYFTDVASFITAKTDRQGDATVSLTLPDNITSWRVTTQAINKDLYAGVNTTKLPVSLPLFVDATLPSEYVVADQPIIKARGYGNSLKTGDKLEFTFEATTLGVSKQTRQGEAFKSEYFEIPHLTQGEHTLKLGISHGNDQDILNRKINVVNSRRQERVHDYYSLQEGLHINSTAERTTLVFTDEGRAKFYNDLVNLTWDEHDRVDSKLATTISYSLLNSYFNQKNSTADSVQWLNYQTQDGGISLLPYGSSDLELSAEVALSVTSTFDQAALKNYFYFILNKRDANKEELSLAYLGLSGLHEPILSSLERFVTTQDLSTKDQLVSALALKILGDEEGARKIYLSVMKAHAEDLKPYIRLNVSKNDVDNLKITMLAAVLSAGLNAPEQDGLWKYVQEKSTTQALFNLEEALYLKERLSHLTSTSASFEMIVDGKKQAYQLTSGNSVELSLSKDQLNTLSFGSIKGLVGVVSIYNKSSQNNNLNGSEKVSVRREYRVNNKPTALFKDGDLVEVRLYPTISSSLPDGSYQITDYLPSGLTFTSRISYSDDQNVCTLVRYPYEVNGRVIKFAEWKGESNFSTCGASGYFSYFARVVSPGSYVAEPTVIQSFQSDGIKNYSSSEIITIKN